MASHGKEFLNSLTRKLIHHVKGTRPIRSAGIVAQIHKIMLGQDLPQLVQNGQAAIARIKYTDRTGIIWKVHV